VQELLVGRVREGTAPGRLRVMHPAIVECDHAVPAAQGEGLGRTGRDGNRLHVLSLARAERVAHVARVVGARAYFSGRGSVGKSRLNTR